MLCYRFIFYLFFIHFFLNKQDEMRIKRIKRNLVSKKIIGFSNLESRQHAYEQIKSMI